MPKRLKEIAPTDTSAVPLEKDAQRQSIAPNIIVRTKPAELLQTRGAADMKPIQGTELLYVTNTDEDIFMHIASAALLHSDERPVVHVVQARQWIVDLCAGGSPAGDFAKIPEGSEKDNVLASVPGTQAAREAVMDAQIPQTAKVERKQRPPSRTMATRNGN